MHARHCTHSPLKPPSVLLIDDVTAALPVSMMPATMKATGDAPGTLSTPGDEPVAVVPAAGSSSSSGEQGGQQAAVRCLCEAKARALCARVYIMIEQCALTDTVSVLYSSSDKLLAQRQAVSFDV
eukprot:10708-Heterococcus_DN1.PRE.1